MGPPSCMRSVVDRNVVMRRMTVHLFKNRLKAATNTHRRQVKSVPKKSVRTTVLNRTTAFLLQARYFTCGFCCETLQPLDSKALHIRYSVTTVSLAHFHLNQRRTQALVTLYCHLTKLGLVETSENSRGSGMSVRVVSIARRFCDLSVLINLSANSHYGIKIIIQVFPLKCMLITCNSLTSQEKSTGK
jgi:hypothetical protein